MDETAELPDVRFFGLVVKGGTTATYRIENEPGLMEICHLTNCALSSESHSKKPIYVKIKSPDLDNQFVLGALVPGQLFSFTTDLLITPDTEFCHTGSSTDEVHLTGYRSINAETLLMEDDDDEDGDSDMYDDEDGDFIDDGADEDNEMDVGDSDEDEDDDEEVPEPKVNERMLQREIKAGAPQRREVQESESEEEEDLDEDEEVDEEDGPDIQRQVMSLVDEQDDIDSDGDDDEDEDADSDDEDKEADPSTKLEAIVQAQQRMREIEREKKRQKLQSTAQKRPVESPEEAPVKRSKKEEAETIPSHPENIKAPTQKFAEIVFRHLKSHGAAMPMNQLSTTLQRPEGAEKMGKMLKAYDSWFKREKQKTARGEVDTVSLL